MITIAFFNNKGGVGKTSMVYHIAWMLRELGVTCVLADLDPQANLTSAFLTDDEVESLWAPSNSARTMFDAIEDGQGNVKIPTPWVADGAIALIPGDLRLGQFEDRLGQAWNESVADVAMTATSGFRVMSAFRTVIDDVGQKFGADIGLIDVGPNLGAMNRAALLGADYLVVPLAADMFSLQGLRNLGPTLRNWRKGWCKRLENEVRPQGLKVPSGEMKPLGYVLLNPSVRENRPVKAYKRWADRIPAEYAEHVLSESSHRNPIDSDPNCIGMIKHYKSLMPLALERRKPMFLLTQADGAIGGHATAVRSCYADFERVTKEILNRL